MKQICLQCGCHFPEDFEDTLKPPCNFWGEHGVSNMSIESKKKFWEWLFLMPVDEISIKEKTALIVNWTGAPLVEGNQFSDVVPNWDQLDESEKKKYQKEFFKKQFLNSTEGKDFEPAKRIN